MAIALILNNFTAQACAADVGPANLEDSQWMSFEHYKDITTRHTTTSPNLVTDKETFPETTPDNGATAMATAPTDSGEATPTTSATTPLVMAMPERALNLPAMPASIRGFSLPTASTEENTTPALPIMNEKMAPDIHLANENWENPTTRAATGGEGDDGAAPNIRLSYLPNTKLIPTASPEHVSVMALDHALVRQLAEKALAKHDKNVDKKSPEERAACAAIDAYKKQQFDALQGDRQTLKALQDAVASLGLQKELGFISDNHGSLNASAASTGGPAASPTTLR